MAAISPNRITGETQMPSVNLRQPRSFAARLVIGAIAASLAMFAVTATAASADPGHHSPGTYGLHVGVLKPVGGATVVTLDPAVATALGSLGIGVAPVAPASSAAAGQISLPITGGRIVYSKTRHGRETRRALNGWVSHSGGLTFTKAPIAPATTPVTLTLSNVVANLSAGKEGKLAASVNGRPFLANFLKLDTAVVDPLDRSISANITLADQGARVLNRTFKSTAFVPGMKLGTIKLTPLF